MGITCFWARCDWESALSLLNRKTSDLQQTSSHLFSRLEMQLGVSLSGSCLKYDCFSVCKAALLRGNSAQRESDGMKKGQMSCQNAATNWNVDTIDPFDICAGSCLHVHRVALIYCCSVCLCAFNVEVCIFSLKRFLLSQFNMQRQL